MADQLETNLTEEIQMLGFQEEEKDHEQLSNIENEVGSVTKSKPVRQFYFVKFWPHENPRSDAIINDAEKLIEKMNREPVQIAQKIREIMWNRYDIEYKLKRLTYQERDYMTDLSWMKEKMRDVQPCLDRLSCQNNAYREKPTNSCLSVGEVDKQKLKLKMLHGRKRRSDERHLLREINASQKQDFGTTLTELNDPIQKVEWQMYRDSFRPDQDVPASTKIARALEKQSHEIAKDKAIANAAVNGKLWNSLGSTEDLKQKVKDYQAGVGKLCAKQQVAVKPKINQLRAQLKGADKDINSLNKKLKDSHRKKEEAYQTIIHRKKQYGEMNACYYQNLVMLKKAKALAEEKNIEALEKLSQEQVEKFMSRWNDCKEFRDDYKKRISVSLNNRQLCKDGRRMMKPVDSIESVTPKFVKPETLSKTRLKWLMKDVQDPAIELFPASRL